MTKIYEKYHEWQQDYYEKNKQEILNRNNNYYEANKIKVLKKQSDYRRERARSYEGKKVQMYKNIVGRINYHPSYKRRKLLFSFDDFLFFLKKNTSYKKHFYRWKKSGYLKKYSPSVDRINNEGDYSLDNIQIISCSENASKADKKSQ